jgi:hypothetical protein
VDFWIFQSSDNNGRLLETNFLPKQSVFGFKKLIENNFKEGSGARCPLSWQTFCQKAKSELFVDN